MNTKVLVFASVISVSCAGCGQNPRVDVNASVSEADVIFDIVASGINGITAIRIYDEKSDDLVWHLQYGGYTPAGKVNYGQFRPIDSKQVFPSDDIKPKAIRGKTVLIVIEYQYDSPVPSGGEFRKRVDIPG